MAIKIANVAASATKFQTRALAAAPNYTAGVQAAGQDWETKTAAADQTWAAGVSDAVSNGRFVKGVQGSASKYQTNAAGKGSQRYPQGVQNAGPAWQNGFAPYAAVIANGTLPPRSPKGSPNNYQRVQYIGDLLHNAKINS